MVHIVGDTKKIVYMSKRNMTGLSDVIIDVKRIGDSTKSINGESMTEETDIAGSYYYNWKPTKDGTYVIKCNSTSNSRIYTETVEVVGRKYWARLGGTQSFGGASITPSTWSIKEKDSTIKLLKDFMKLLKLSQDNIEKLNTRVSRLGDSISKVIVKTNVSQEEITNMRDKVDIIENDNKINVQLLAGLSDVKKLEEVLKNGRGD